MKRNAVFFFIVSLICFALAWECGTSAVPFMEALDTASTGFEQFSFTIPTGLLVLGTALGIIGGIFFLGAGIGTLKKLNK